MTAFSANPLAYIFPAIVLVAVAGYYAYGAVDRVGLATYATEAIVTGKQFTPGSTTYNTNIAAGRAWTQSQQQPDVYAVTLQVGGEQTVALVGKATFDALKVSDRARVQARRTRISGQLQVTEVKK
jgi:hypothetical protein